MQGILQMQFVAKAWAKYYKEMALEMFWLFISCW